MSLVIQGILCIIAGYLVGNINAAYIVGRMKGFDIRAVGSRNAGGSNAIITMGKAVGAVCCLFDIFKAYAVISIMTYLFPQLRYSFALTSVSVILGHIFPIVMHFKGGKGLACLGGSILAYSPKLFIILLVVELIFLLIVNYLCVVPISASIAYPVLYGILESSIVGALILLPVSVVMFGKHIENLKRIHQGTELHFSYLWNKEEEQRRITENIRKIDETAVDTLWLDQKRSK